MGFTLGRQNRGVYGSRTQVPTPQSTNFADRAQRRIDQTAGMVAARAVEAVRVNGHICHVWNRLPRGGVPCSCGGKQAGRVTEMDRDAQDFSPGVEDAIRFDLAHDLQPDGADEPDIGRGISLKLRGNLLSNPAELLDIPSPKHGVPAADAGVDLDASDLSDESNGIGGPIGGESDYTQLQSLGDLLDLVAGGDLNICGICHGTGFVDGFRFVEGQRIVLEANEAQAGVVLSLDGVDVNRSTKPASFNLSRERHYARWSVEIPLCLEVLVVRLYDNNAPVESEFILEGRSGNNAFAVIDAAWLLSVAGQRVDIQVRPREDITGDGFVAFTHVEILLRQRPPVMIQIPQLQSLLNVEYQDPVIYTQFEVEPTIESLHRESVIEVPELGMIFRVTEVTNSKTAKQQVFRIDGQIRAVQPTEKINQMRLSGWRDPQASPFRGLERSQGGLPLGIPTIDDLNPNPALDRGTSDDDLLGGREAPSSTRRS